MSLRPALTDGAVRRLRRARAKGEPVLALARRFRVDRSAVERALYGRSPYEGIRDPAPTEPGLPAAALPLSMAQVRELRALVSKGGRISVLAVRFGVAHASVRKAVYGQPPYDRFRDPPPLRPSCPQNRALLSVEQVRSMRRMRLDGASFVAIAREFKTGTGTVANALHGTHAYHGITDPGPVRTGAGLAKRRLTPVVVATARERATRGESLWRIAKDLGIPRWLVGRAVFGRGAYASIRDPPPLRARASTERRSFTDEQVRALRRKRIAGTGFALLQLEAGASRKTVRDAVYGRGAYRGIWYPYPPETGRDGSYPALTQKEVGAIRRAAAAGEKAAALAERFHIHTSTAQRAIYGRVPYHRFPEPPPLEPRRAHHGTSLTATQVAHARQAFRRGIGALALAKELGASVSTVRHAIFGKGMYQEVTDPPPARPRVVGPRRRLTDAEVRYARVLRREGWSLAKVAGLLKVTTVTVALAVLGLSPYGGAEGPTPSPDRGTATLPRGKAPKTATLEAFTLVRSSPRTTPRGPGAALDDEQVREARHLRGEGVSLRELALRYGVDHQTVQTAVFGRGVYAGITDPPALPPSSRGGKRVLGKAQVQKARRLRRGGATVPGIMRVLGVSEGTVKKALMGRGPYVGLGGAPPLRPGEWSTVRALDEQEVRHARRRRLAGGSLRDLGRELGVSAGTLRAALAGRPPYAGIEEPGPIAPRRYRARRGVPRSERA
ncbi:MAG: hypothetical protein KGJ23_15980 [Euryarchaeota archaeon]|nr:hypothetical protein [Euryarchaeota archaeon]MDE1838098.1 hypothetical protein [Euryarchaeota archaeon]MDE2046580.1 hypothetical protein [Thermoplasmata archaeon]